MDLAATDWRPAAVYVQAGVSSRGSGLAGVGARWPTGWQPMGGRLALALEVGLTGWSARQETGVRQESMQLTVTPVFRWRGAAGTSPWFLEAGIGVSHHTRDYVAKTAHQGTRWNFNDVLGVGRRFGSHEVALRLAHFSNGGFTKPNPGDTSVSLRWSVGY